MAFMQFLKPDINVDFTGKRRIAYVVSGLMILISLVSLAMRGGPRYGIDFAGGLLIQVKTQAAVQIDQLRQGLEPIGLAKAMIQTYGETGQNEFLIRTEVQQQADGFAESVRKAIETSTGTPVELRRIEMVGPQVGKDLQEKALFAIFFSLLFIAIFVSGRFEQKWMLSAVLGVVLGGVVYLLFLFKASIPLLILAAMAVTVVMFWYLDLKYAMGAVVSLVHDVTITLGFLSICDKEMTISVVASLLTILGYSLNDTIIVYDRIRENLRKLFKQPMETVINRSINETLSRTIITQGITLAVVLALVLFGGEIIHDFALALLVGVGVGTYSSIYVASPILLDWKSRKPSERAAQSRR